MKQLPLVIAIVVMALLTFVTGCGRAPRYDSRLVAADSLMHDYPDSALAIVEAVSPDSLAGEDDRAYRDLLLTQARYKCYIVATTDSGINRALGYYRAHASEREKLTRAYIYKGAVMEELNHPDSAMLYYKHAVATAAPDDYFNLGYSQLKIAELYQAQISQDSAAIIRLKDAINNFKIINDTNYLISSYGDLGAICGTREPDTAKYYLQLAIELSQKSNPTKQYTYKSKLSGIYLYCDKNYERAKELAIDVITNGAEYSEEPQFYYYAVLSYIQLHLIDSAKYIANIIPAPSNAIDSMIYFDTHAELAKIKKEHEKYGITLLKNMELKTDFISGLQENKLIEAEVEFDKLHDINKEKAKTENIICFTLVTITLFIIIILIMKLHIWRHRKTIKKIHKQLKDSLEELEQERKKFYHHNQSIRQLVSYRISALQELYYEIRVKAPANYGKTKQIIPLSSLFKSMNERNELLNLNLRDTFWKKIILSVDGEYNGIATFVTQRYPNLSDKDKKLFYLSCANIPPQIIKLCLNFTNAKTVSNYKIKLIRNTLGFDMFFEEFINRYMNGEIS